MIEEGGIYKLKKIKDFFGTNTEDEFKVLKISGDTVYCQNTETKELNMFNKKDFIDPDFPDDIYSDIEIVMEKLNTKMKPMNLSFWKELAEDLGGCVSASAASGGGMASLGTMPCPAMAQITGGSISGAMVNGVPVAGKSVKKKKKKKKHEEYEETSYCMGHPTHNFAAFKGETDNTPEFEDAIDILVYGDETDLQEYIDLCTLFTDTDRYDDYVKFAKEKYNLDAADLDCHNVGKIHLYDKELIEQLCKVSSYMNKDETLPALRFDEAINLLTKGNSEKDKQAYEKLLDLFTEHALLDEFEKYANMEYGINDITSDNITLRENMNTIIDKLLNEDFNEDYEAITGQIAKYLDRLNFKFANTEDIIYKKEGDNKYLFKFDNEIGIIKIKVLHNDEVLIEKEYEIDETQDIQPIFDEIEKIYKEYGL